ncbi:TonB-dependent receptor [Sphingomonas rubra]|uniref:TonB-dependent receptor n=1 Tax=Sphingomonas rubra TaxID=634430 RepID=A0A1I5REI6_9SPHN|nr:TonB-dependent receptor [Sphingomonas rubra]SFP56790.1 TonB-dependent receptor [Sphingomonas rubra]
MKANRSKLHLMVTVAATAFALPHAVAPALAQDAGSVPAPNSTVPASKARPAQKEASGDRNAASAARPSDTDASTTGSVSSEGDQVGISASAGTPVPAKSPVTAVPGPGDLDPTDVVVTGYRASLSSAQQIKRDADAIVDVVVAQDIGKLPDNTAAESVARVAGIQVDRFGDEVRQVLVRGLPDLATTFNGRDIFTGELRRSQLQDFPAGALAGLEVYKSGTADLLEPGLAGLINVRSRRAFDFNQPFTIAGGFRGTYNDQSNKYDPNGNLLLAVRKDTPVGEIGILVNGSYNQSRYRNAIRVGSGTITTLSVNQRPTPVEVGRSFRYPDRVSVANPSGKRVRPSGNMSVQWKPASNLEVYYDFLFQGFRQDGYNDQFDVFLRSGSPPPALSDVVLVEGTDNLVESFTKTGGDRAQTFRSTSKSYTNTFQNALGFKWQAGRARISADLAYTRSEYGIDEWSFDTATTVVPVATVQFFADGGNAFALPGFDALDPNNYKWRGYFERTNRTNGKGWQGRTDLELETDVSILPKLQFGVRWSDRDGSLRNGTRYAFTERLNIPLTGLGLGDLVTTQDAFRTDVQGLRSWLAPARGAIIANQEALRLRSIAALQQLIATTPATAANDAAIRDWRTNLPLLATENVQLDPTQGFRGEETTYAVYGQGRYDLSSLGLDIDGLFGVRVVNTVGRYSGVGRVTSGGVTTAVERSTDANYLDILPNVSMRIRPTDKLQLRLAATKTRTRPDFSQLNPAVTITEAAPPPPPTPGVPVEEPCDPRFPVNLCGRVNATGSGGNPNLRPLVAHNYDATIEYYFSRTASITGAVFYRDLDGFISNYLQRFIDPVYGLIQTTSPQNAGAGRIKGWELGGQTFFDFLPGALKGIGVQANVTYVDGKTAYPLATNADGSVPPTPPLVRIPFVSKWTYNAALFYERNGISSRLSYNRRSPFVTGNLYTNGIYTGEGVLAIERLDFSISYNPIKQLTLTIDATNLLAKPFRSYIDYLPERRYTRDVRDEGRYFGIGSRFRF